jgi:hypothetical protein
LWHPKSFIGVLHIENIEVYEIIGDGVEWWTLIWDG